MIRNILFAAISIVLASGASDCEAKSSKAKAGHKFKTSADLQYRTNKNVSLATAGGIDYADLSDFGSDDDDEADVDEDDDDDDLGDSFDDLIDVDPDEDDIEEDDEVDEDGDGIDDLIDPNVDNVVDQESRYSLKLALNHKYTFEGGAWAWSNGLRFASDTYQQRDDLDKFNYAATTGLEYSPADSKHKVRPSISYVVLEKDAGRFVSTYVVSLAYGYQLSERVTLGATYNYQDKNIAKPGSPDSTVDTLALSADFKLSDLDIVKLKYAPKVEDSTKVTRDTDAWGYEISYTRKLPWEMTAGVGYQYDRVEHVNLMPCREDDSSTWGVEFTKAFGKRLSVEAGWDDRQRESNIPNKDADNQSFYLGIGYKL